LHLIIKIAFETTFFVHKTTQTFLITVKLVNEVDSNLNYLTYLI